MTRLRGVRRLARPQPARSSVRAGSPRVTFGEAAQPLISRTTRSTVTPSGSAHSESQRSRLDRFSVEAAAGGRVERTLVAIETFCAEAEHDLCVAEKAVEEESIAWLTLCARGWPHDVRADAGILASARGWMAEWSEYITLPVRVDGAQDLSRQSSIREQLSQCEAALRPSLPDALRILVDPLDETGRATLACALQALAACIEARERALLAIHRTVALRERAQRLTTECTSLGLVPPSDTLEIAAWRRAVATARSNSNARSGCAADAEQIACPELATPSEGQKHRHVSSRCTLDF